MGFIPGAIPIVMTSESLCDIRGVVDRAEQMGFEARGILLDLPGAWFTNNETGRDTLPQNISHISFMSGHIDEKDLLHQVQMGMP